MKKSFKKAIAILLAVMMIVCSFPLTVLAAGESRTNIDLRFGDVSNTATPKTYLQKNPGSLGNFDKYTGLNSTALDYDKNTGKINGYGNGDYFTVTVLMRNVTELAAAEVAIKYSKSITPAYISTKRVANQPLTHTYGEEAEYAAAPKYPSLEALPEQSGNAIHNNGTFTVGETSYIDAENNVMYANFAAQTGAPRVDTKSVTVGKETFKNTAVLATFMFKIVSDDPITFNIATDAADKYKTYYLNTAANGGKVSEYELYDRVDTESPALDFLGENEYNEPSVKTYTITFVDENGEKIQEYTYDENAPIIETPAFPASTKIDGTNHTAYKWDKDVPATATANVTIKRVKFNEAHTWGEWNEKKPATTTETGLKERECSVCHAKETQEIPKLPEAHVHKWGEWKYNGDAKWDATAKVGTNGTQTRTCTECGKTETKEAPHTDLLIRRAGSIMLSNSILMCIMTHTNVINYYDEVWCEIERENGQVEIVNEYSNYLDGKTYQMFTFNGVTPQTLANKYKITIHGKKDGVEYWGDTIQYAVTDYVVNTMKKATTSQKDKNLLADLCKYAYQVQVSMKYKLDQPITDFLKPEEKLMGYNDPLSMNTVNDEFYVKCDNPKVKIRTTLRMGAAVDIAFVLSDWSKEEKIDYSKVKVKIVKNVPGKAPEVFWYNKIDNPDNFETLSGMEYVYFTEVFANQLDVPVDCTVYAEDGVTVLSNTRRYSVESYCTSQINKGNKTGATASQKQTATLCDALMRYGNSTKLAASK